MRTFIAVKLNQKIKEELIKAQEELKKIPAKIKWTSPENFHITLKFLGSTCQKKLNQVKKVISNTTAQNQAFNARTEKLSFFPNRQNPRILFVNCFSNKKLENISQNLEEELEKIGFIKEKKFKPHITLARIKSLENIEQLKEKAEKLNISGSFKIKNILLYQSTLTHQGPVYEEIFKISLRK